MEKNCYNYAKASIKERDIFMSVKLFIKTKTTKGLDKDIVKVTWGAVNNAGRIFYSNTEVMSVTDFLIFKELFANIGLDEEKRIDTGRDNY